MPRPSLISAALALSCAAALVGQDGRELFLRNCATCHGTAGRGDGPSMVTPRPRDLTSGKFSFGTAPDAIERTIRGGIAPSMPTFDDLLGPAEIDALVAYVRSLMPVTLDAAPAESQVRPGPRPRIVRGYLPPFPGATTPIGHGMVIGLPNGFTLTYQSDDLRLLQTRVVDPDHPFVDRTDWRGRGGTPLQLLGEPLDPHPSGSFGVAAELSGVGVDLRIELRSTRIDGDLVRFEGDLFDGRQPIARWREELRAVQIGDGQGFHRRIEVHGARAERSLYLVTAGLRIARVRRHERPTVRGLEIWYAGAGNDPKTVETLGIRGPQVTKSALRGGVGKVLVPVGDRPFTRIDVLRLRLPEFDPDRAGDLAEAFDR